MNPPLMKPLRQKLVAWMGTVFVTASVCSGEETNWGKWGKNDQLGTLNYITPQSIVAAAGLVRDGRSYSLAAPMGNGPLAVDPAFLFTTTSTQRSSSSPSATTMAALHSSG